MPRKVLLVNANRLQPPVAPLARSLGCSHVFPLLSAPRRERLYIAQCPCAYPVDSTASEAALQEEFHFVAVSGTAE